jgi:putative colanic acid biosynthesis glycosyltransferase WcaI
MRILLLNQFFWPDLAATSQLLTDLAAHLAGEGHRVTVVCGRSLYAGTDSTPAPKVEIIRVSDLPFSRGSASRLLSYFSFLSAALWHSCRIERPDLVITLTTPPLLSVVGLLLKRFRGAPYFIWEMDLYPDLAVDLKVLRADSWIVRLIGAIADHCRNQAEGVIALGSCMRRRLIARGIQPKKIEIAENWANGKLIYPEARRSPDRFSVLYPGNLGLAHDVETVSAVMDRLKTDERFRFTYVGGGPRVKDLQAFCEAQGIRTASFLPYCDRDQLTQLLGTANVGLVTQNPSCLGSLVPSKVYSLLAAGLPVLFIGPRSATPGQILERFQCGWQIDCGNVDGMTSLLHVLAANPDLARNAGYRAREAFLAHYDAPTGVSRICKILGIPESSLVLTSAG